MEEKRVGIVYRFLEREFLFSGAPPYLFWWEEVIRGGCMD